MEKKNCLKKELKRLIRMQDEIIKRYEMGFWKNVDSRIDDIKKKYHLKSEDDFGAKIGIKILGYKDDFTEDLKAYGKSLRKYMKTQFVDDAKEFEDNVGEALKTAHDVFKPFADSLSGYLKKAVENYKAEAKKNAESSVEESKSDDDKEDSLLNPEELCKEIFDELGLTELVDDEDDIPTASDDDTDEKEFVANKNSKVFHLKTCSQCSRMSESVREEHTDTYDGMLAKGYKPCKSCLGKN